MNAWHHADVIAHSSVFDESNFANEKLNLHLIICRICILIEVYILIEVRFQNDFGKI